MSITTTLKIEGIKPQSKAFNKLDPTVILRLHSILSGIDIFELNKKFEYEIERTSKENVQMTLPNNFVQLLKKLTKEDSHHILEKWYLSIEVAMNDWGISEAQGKFKAIKDLCIKAN